MLFEAPINANLEVLCRNQLQKRHPVTGDVIETIPAVYARFGKMGATYTYTDPLTQQDMQGADIQGHFFDTEIEAVELGWDQETKEMVERTLLRFCETQPDRIRLIERETPKAAKPWPTYDETPVEKVAEFAAVLGLVAETIAYEQENRARPAALDDLAAVGAKAGDGFEVADEAAAEPVEERLPRAADGPQEVGNPRTITV